MSVVATGTIHGGAITLDQPLSLKDGQKVIVRVEEAPCIPTPLNPLSDEEFRALPFFGDWADRDDLGSSAEYVREERAKWSQRPHRKD